MKKTLFLLAALAVLAGCGNQPKPTENPASKQDAFTVETYDVIGDQLFATEGEGENAYEIRGSYQCTVDIPVTDNQALRDSICYWIDQNFGSSYDGDPRDLKAMINFYKNWALDPDGYVEPEGFDISYTVRMLEATDQYVTYSFENFYETSSSPSGYSEKNYRTFDRNTGKHFTRQMVKADETLEELVMSTLLEQYFSDIYPDDDYADLLFFDPDDLEERGFWLPEFTDPFLLYDNLYFYYWEHDIADRVTGQPNCSLPYDVIEPYLTEEGKQYFKH